MTSKRGLVVSAWGQRVRRSGLRRVRGVIIGPNRPVSFPSGRRVPRGNRVVLTRRSSTLVKSRLSLMCCARTGSLMRASPRCGRRCSTRVSTCVRSPQCTEYFVITAWPGNAGNANPATIHGRGLSRPLRTWCGCGISAGSPARTTGPGFTCTRSGICVPQNGRLVPSSSTRQRCRRSHQDGSVTS